MIKFNILAIAAVLLSANLAYSAAEQEPNALDYFSRIRSSILSNLPSSYSCRIVGSSINRKLASIPKDSRLNQDVSPFAELDYSKLNGINIVVNNVDDLYRGLYKDLPKQIFAFEIILSSQDEQGFINKYNITFGKVDNGGLTILRLQVRNAENNLLLFIDGTGCVTRIDYYLGSSPVSSSLISYKTISVKNAEYIVPEIITSVNGGNSASTEDIEFDNFNTGPGRL